MKKEDNNLKGNKTIICKGIIFWSILFIGIIIGILATISIKYKNLSSRKDEQTSFRLGLVENNLTITGIKWSDFPGWRNIECNIEGTFSINLPHDASIDFCDLLNNGCLKEIHRKTIHSQDNNMESNYDLVHYEITNGVIAATGVLKKYDNPISIAESGYQVRATWNGSENYIILGYIPPESVIFTPWSNLENTYANCDLTPYFDAFQLSRTYLDESLASKIPIQSNINVVKVQDGLMNCRIENCSDKEWTYSADLPALEMWYNGVWIEVLPPYDSALMTQTCASNEIYEINVPSDTNNNYPSLFPGIYRLVIYGTEDDYAVSNSFLVLYNHDIQLLND